jgi:riboflavin transporter FmnP
MPKTYRLVATAMLAALAFVLQYANGVLGLQTGFGMTIDLVAVPIVLALFLFGVESSIEVLAVATIFIALFAQTGPIGAAMKFAATAPTVIVFAAYMIARGRGGGAPALALAALAAVVFSVGLYAAGGMMQSALGGSSGLLFGLLPIIAMALIIYAALKHFGRQGKVKDALHKASIFADARTVALLAVAVIIIRGAAMIVSNFYFAGPLYFKISPEQFVSLLNSSDLLFFGKGAAWYVAIFAFNAIQAALEIAVAWLVAYRFGFARKYSS